MYDVNLRSRTGACPISAFEPLWSHTYNVQTSYVRVIKGPYLVENIGDENVNVNAARIKYIWRPLQVLALSAHYFL